MIEYDHKNNCLDLECDTCGQEMSFDGDYKYSIKESKAAGWKFNFSRMANKWFHYCCEACRLGETE